MGIVSQPFQKQLNPLLLWEGADSDRNLRHCLHLHVWVQWSTFGWSVHSGIFWGDSGHRTHVHQGTSYPQQKIRLPIYMARFSDVFCVGALLIVEGKGYILTTFCFIWCRVGFQTHSDLISAVRQLRHFWPYTKLWTKSCHMLQLHRAQATNWQPYINWETKRKGEFKCVFNPFVECKELQIATAGVDMLRRLLSLPKLFVIL